MLTSQPFRRAVAQGPDGEVPDGHASSVRDGDDDLDLDRRVERQRDHADGRPR